MGFLNENGLERLWTHIVAKIGSLVETRMSNLNISNGTSAGSLRSSGSLPESSSYTLGNNAFTEGYITSAKGSSSHAEGTGCRASSDYQHVQGKFNIEDQTNTYLDIIGNGTSDGARSNAATVDRSGNAWYAGDVYTGSTSGTNKDSGSKKLATEEYVNNLIQAINERLNNLGV